MLNHVRVLAESQFLRCFPGEAVSAKVTVSARFLVDWLT